MQSRPLARAHTRAQRSLAYLGLLVPFAMLASLGVHSAEAETRTLRFLTWDEYTDPDLVTEFEASHHAQVEFSYYETDEERDEILVQSRGRGYDVILVSDDALGRYRGRDWLVGMNESSVPNLQHMEKRWRETAEDGMDYGVPYAWGTSGIAYRSDLVSEPITRWMDLFHPQPSIQGKILMVADSWELVGVSLLALGFDFNSEEPEQLDAAGDLLLGQRSYVSRYGYPNLTEQSSLVTGETLAATMYSGDALALRDVDPRVTYVVPEEGTFLWCDYVTVSSAASDPELALEFVDFLQVPKNAARTSEYLYYASPNTAATKLLPEELLTDENVYPSEEAMAHAYRYEIMSPRTIRKRSSIYQNVVGNIAEQ
ncbi:MAG: spermidine/putrescine ABC transporter substrate-binding protein [Candidatus Eisenbacteria bacterium]